MLMFKTVFYISVYDELILSKIQWNDKPNIYYKNDRPTLIYKKALL